MAWIPLAFGKYNGKTLPQILFIDPDWFFWAMSEKVFNNKGALTAQAKEIDIKARNIRVPVQDGEDRVVEYLIHRPTMKFGDMRLVPRNQPIHEGASPACRSEVIDLSFPREHASYDKRGYQLILSCVKHYLFGDSNHRMTRKRCEHFFDDDSNFV